MSSIGVIGTLAIAITEGEDTHIIASLRSARLSVSVDMVDVAPVPGTAWKSVAPGELQWTAESDFLQLVEEESGLRQAFLLAVETLCLNRTAFDVLFTSPTGATYSSRAYINELQIGNGFEDGYSGSYSVTGIQELVLVEPDGEGE